jgi:ABC-type dipeptide/oligopeptide/nickel transport system ATPase component
VLAGEPPDPTRVPQGCRFHPRCPALASGAAARVGVDEDCRTSSVAVLPAGAGHAAACFLAEALAASGRVDLGRDVRSSFLTDS